MNLQADMVLLIGGFLISLFGFSIMLGDNWLFRLAISLISGAIAGFVILLLTESVFVPYVLTPILSAELGSSAQITLALVLLAALLLLLRSFTRSRAGGSLVLAILLAISVTITILGIINGTLITLYRGILSQVLIASEGSASKSQWLNAGLILAGTAFSLLYTRHYSLSKNDGRQTGQHSWVRSMGDLFIGIALGAIFAGCLIASASILIDHLGSLIGDGRAIMDLLRSG